MLPKAAPTPATPTPTKTKKKKTKTKKETTPSFAISSEVKDAACAEFTVDLSAAGFGVCTCGHKKAEHTASMAPHGYSGRRRSSSSSASSSGKKKKTKKKTERGSGSKAGRVQSLTYPASVLADAEAAAAAAAAAATAAATEKPTSSRSRTSSVSSVGSHRSRSNSGRRPSVDDMLTAAAVSGFSFSNAQGNGDADASSGDSADDSDTKAEVIGRLLELLDGAGSEWSPRGGKSYAVLTPTIQQAIRDAIASAQIVADPFSAQYPDGGSATATVTAAAAAVEGGGGDKEEEEEEADLFGTPSAGELFADLGGTDGGLFGAGSSSDTDSDI